MEYADLVEWVGQGIEATGVGVIVAGAAGASFRHLRRLQAKDADAYSSYRRELGRSILLGLEFLVAGDIIRTVAIEPTFTSVGILAVVVLIRTFLSLSLETEISGRVPWRSRA